MYVDFHWLIYSHSKIDSTAVIIIMFYLLVFYFVAKLCIFKNIRKRDITAVTRPAKKLKKPRHSANVEDRLFFVLAFLYIISYAKYTTSIKIKT